MRFDGSNYVPALDEKRLSLQYERIYALMIDGVWRTLSEIASITGDPEASISAQLRHMRKKRNGEYVVEKNRRGQLRSGLYEYQLHLRSDGDAAKTRKFLIYRGSIEDLAKDVVDLLGVDGAELLQLAITEAAKIAEQIPPDPTPEGET